MSEEAQRLAEMMTDTLLSWTTNDEPVLKHHRNVVRDVAIGLAYQSREFWKRHPDALAPPQREGGGMNASELERATHALMERTGGGIRPDWNPPVVGGWQIGGWLYIDNLSTGPPLREEEE